jgi:putative PIN family toxin of toxin-antitoxin system
MSDFFVFVTNSLISAALVKDSTSRKALDKPIDLGLLAISNNTFDELIEVLFRKKFDTYFPDDNERWVLINKLEINSTLFIPDITINDCRDPKDNKFLELAISSNASCIETGVKALLVLHLFRNIPILNAFDFIHKF